MVGEDTTPAEANIYRKAQTKDVFRLRRRRISIEKHKRKNANEDTTPAEANIYRTEQTKDCKRGHDSSGVEYQ